MTVPTATNRNDYVGNGAANEYSYTFRILSQTDLRVIVRNTSGVETVLTITTDYTVAGVGDLAGGTVTLVDDSQAWLTGGFLTTDYVLAIRRLRTLTQDTEISNQGPFYPKAHENVFDHLLMVSQQQQDEVDRSVKLPETIDPSTFDMSLPTDIEDSPGSMILVNETGNGLVMGPDAGDIAAAQANAAAAAASAVEAQTAETNAELAETNAELAETNAELAETNAELAETNAEAAQVAAEAAQVAAEAAAAAAVAASTRFRNRIINPTGAVYQRDNPATTDAVYFADRWYMLTQTASVTPEKISNPEAGYRDGVRITQTQAAAQRFGFAQVIEGRNCVDLRGSAVVLSPRIRSSSTTTIRYAILEWTGTEDSLGAGSDVVNSWTNGTYTAGQFFKATTTNVIAVGSQVATANTWTTLDELDGTIGASANNIVIFIWTSAAESTNYTLDFDFVQFEKGTTATEFERREYSEELAMCQRYYFKTFDQDVAPAQNTGDNAGAVLYTTPASGVSSRAQVCEFPVPMRGTGSITYFNIGGANDAWRNLTGAADSATGATYAFGHRSLILENAQVGGDVAGNYIGIHFTVEAEL